jgi:hypothetical protein
LLREGDASAHPLLGFSQRTKAVTQGSRP